jgi:hypothetical protein
VGGGGWWWVVVGVSLPNDYQSLRKNQNSTHNRSVFMARFQTIPVCNKGLLDAVSQFQVGARLESGRCKPSLRLAAGEGILKYGGPVV